MRSDLFTPDHQETAARQPGMVLLNSKMLKVARFVIVQPSEELPVSVLSGNGGGNQSGSGGLSGDLMGR
jgi:hypothetical protein